MIYVLCFMFLTKKNQVFVIARRAWHGVAIQSLKPSPKGGGTNREIATFASLIRNDGA